MSTVSFADGLFCFLGMVSLSLPESGASKASAAYLSFFIMGSAETSQLHQIVKEFGQDLTTRLLRCIGKYIILNFKLNFRHKFTYVSYKNVNFSGGETPRQCMDPIIDVLLALNKKYCEDLARWLPSVLGQENFPTPQPTVQEKEHFVQCVLRFVNRFLNPKEIV